MRGIHGSLGTLGTLRSCCLTEAWGVRCSGNYAASSCLTQTPTWSVLERKSQTDGGEKTTSCLIGGLEHFRLRGELKEISRKMNRGSWIYVNVKFVGPTKLFHRLKLVVFVCFFVKLLSGIWRVNWTLLGAWKCLFCLPRPPPICLKVEQKGPGDEWGCCVLFTPPQTLHQHTFHPFILSWAEHYYSAGFLTL